jgi:malate dehydrogenase (oxaloacetate-decarboxylating)
MLMAASETLAKHSPLVNNGEGPVLPELKDIQTVSRAIAFAVGKVAQEQGVAVKTSAEALLQAIAITSGSRSIATTAGPIDNGSNGPASCPL